MPVCGYFRPTWMVFFVNFGKKKMHEVRGVLTIRLVAVSNNFCLAIRSRMVSLTMFCLVET